MSKDKKARFTLSRFEIILWIVSVIVVSLSFVFSDRNNYLTLVASLLGVSALIFLAKGHYIGQIMIIIFALLYALISYDMKYYGEMITYLGMTAPMAVVALISWLRHPFKDSCEVQVSYVTKKHFIFMTVSCCVVTAAFYFILKYFGNASLIISTISIATSYIAAYLTAIRSPFYALGYGANDVILIILWVIAAIKDIGNLSMVACFVMFLINDMYGFYNWRKMKIKQSVQ